MKSGDYSKEIYRKYYANEQPEIKMFLQDGKYVVGIIVAIFHGDVEADEPFVIKWHVVPKEDVGKYYSADEKSGIGWVIEQENIEAVRLN